MGSGLSMASVNKIKELANQREYSLALDIIDSQDLSKSLNPQFLRLCGEIFIKSKRYKDARKTLLMARKLTPAAKRIIFSLIDLYMRMGYKSLVEKYYEIYMFDADYDSMETKQLNYIYDKYCGKSPKELEDYIVPYYIDNLDYDWSFEVFLLLCMEDKDDIDEDIKKNLVDEYLATFKNSKNSKIIASIKDDESIAESLFYSFNKIVEEDDDPKQEKLRKEEKLLFEADELRINPKEAEIIEIIDDEDEKNYKNKKRRNTKEDDLKSEQTDNENLDSRNEEGKASDDLDSEENKKSASESDSEEKEKKTTGFFRKLFVRDKNKEESSTETVEAKSESVEAETEAKSEQETVEIKEEPEKEVSEADNEPEVMSLADEDTETVSDSETKISDAADIESEPVENITETTAEIPGNEDFEMHKNVDEINNNLDNFSDDFTDFSEEDSGDEFEAESDTIEDLHLKENVSNEDNVQSDTEQINKKSGVLFEAADISLDEDEDEKYEIDDFSTPENDEFGSIDTSVDNYIEMTENTEAVTEEFSDDVFEEIEEIVDSETEVEAVVEEDAEEAVEAVEAEIETKVEESVEDVVEAESEAVFEEITETETEITEESDSEEIKEEVSNTEEVIEADIEAESVTEDDFELEEETDSEVKAEVNDSVEETTEIEETTESEETVEDVIETEEEEVFEEITEAETEITEESDFEEIKDESSVAEDETEEVTETEEIEEIEEVTQSDEVTEDVIETEEEEIFEEITETETEITEETTDLEEVTDSEVEAEVETTVEEITEEVIETSPEVEGVSEEVEEVIEAAPEEDEMVEEEYEEEDLSELFRLEKEKIKNENKEKKLEFPVFRSSLFPNYRNDKPEIKNNFNEVMNDRQSKISENLEKEAQLQKETEALLASLGIDLGSTKSTVTSSSGIKTDIEDKANSISRKELKNSLKIGEDKKIILRKMKEYR